MTASARHLTSLADVAKRAGVSVATASRVLSNSDYPVAPETRKRVLEAAADLDFTPNRIARGLVAQRTFLVGVMVKDVASEHDALLARGIEDIASENDFSVVVHSTDDDPERELEMMRQLRATRTDAVIYGCSSACHDADEAELVEQLRIMEESGRVLVRVAPHPGLAPDVSFSTTAALELAVKHLVDLGHARFALVTGPQASGASTVARHAAAETFDRFGLDAGAVATLHDDLSFEGGQRVGHALSDLAVRPTAVVATDDRLAIGILRAFADAGIDVPGDISVMGLDDIPIASIVTPPLTTVHVERREMGRLAMQTAIWLLGGGSRMGRNNVPVELVVRASTGPPSGAK